MKRPKFIYTAFPRDKFPHLYSKRGFEKKRVKFIMPDNIYEFAYVLDSHGNKLDVEL